jgi:hypothetical protein
MLLVLVAIGAAAVTAFECPEINADQTTVRHTALELPWLSA